MQITEVNITPIKPDNGLVGIASLVFEGAFYLGSIGIYTRPQGGFRLTYPTRGKFNIFHPINRAVADAIEREVLNKFEEVMSHHDRHHQVVTR